ncbi:MAG TPA: arsenite efflux transporter metallochaperone ArsD [Methanocella sp.]|nr:arsenite efflux transporter metallochaperone ArsD [Methanocella sp.]
MKKELTIFEGAICCPTGVCGPNPDKELIEFNETLKKLGETYKGLKITRASMSFNVQLFMQTPAIRDLVKTHGPSILPVTVIDGAIVKKQQYPKYAELTQLLDG